MRLLQAAAELFGSEEALAHRLGIPQARLARYMAGRSALPPDVLLRIVDLLQQERDRADPSFGAGPDSDPSRLAD